MKTATKIAIARTLYYTIKACRTLIGKSDTCRLTTNNVNYILDLNDGIDFAVFLGRYEPSTTRALKRLIKPGDTVLDIGANVGIHTMLMAHLVGSSGHVFAFEPTDRAFSKLGRNEQCNPSLAGRISAMQVFLASSDMATPPSSIPANWPLDSKRSQGTHLHGKHLGEFLPTTNVRTLKLDTAMSEAGILRFDGMKSKNSINLIKLDVDGYECDLLAGATETLKAYKPTLIMELAPYLLREQGGSLKNLLEPLYNLGYKLHDEASFKPIMETPEELENLIADGSSRNVIAAIDLQLGS